MKEKKRRAARGIREIFLYDDDVDGMVVVIADDDVPPKCSIIKLPFVSC